MPPKGLALFLSLFLSSPPFSQFRIFSPRHNPRPATGSERQPASFADDARFSRVHVDPRFKRLDRAKQSKQDVDKRFASMFTDKDFTTSVKVRIASTRAARSCTCSPSEWLLVVSVLSLAISPTAARFLRMRMRAHAG